jgi:hypothetical protein
MHQDDDTLASESALPPAGVAITGPIWVSAWPAPPSPRAASRPGIINPAAELPTLLFAEEVALLLRVNRAHIFRLNELSELPSPQGGQAKWQWRRDELLAWIDAGRPDRRRWYQMQDEWKPSEAAAPSRRRTA